MKKRYNVIGDKMKKIVLILMTLVLCLSTTACFKKTDAEIFKKEYESLNGKTTETGKTYRTVEIPKENPFVYQTAEQIVERIDKKESFVVYFGFAKCPWCRSMVEQLIKSAADNGITTIYYVDVLDIRDEFELSNTEGPTQTKEGTEGYNNLLDRLDSVLADYKIVNDAGEQVNVKEKRIYAPNVVAVVEGEPEKLVEGVSADLKDPYSELTNEMIEESYNSFKCLWKCLEEKSTMCQKNAC